jgi:hypothetical protein
MDAIEPSGHVPSTPVGERLFLDLDGRWFGAAGDRWRMLTPRMAPSGGVAQLILALTAWLASPEPRPHLLSIG